MNYLYNVFLNAFSVLMLAVIWSYARIYGDSDSKHSRYFKYMLLTNMIMLVIDTLSRTDGRPDSVFPYINHSANFLLFLFSPAISSMWVMYVHYFMGHTQRSLKLVKAIIIEINSINAVLAVLSLKYGWYYYIDSQNIYHRGPLYFLSNFLSFFLLGIAVILIADKRQTVGRKHYFALIAFIFPPVLCVTLQSFFYGFSFIFNGVALSLLIMFLYVHIQDIFTDYLTGISNRKKLETFLRKKQQASTPDNTFSAIMLDVDDFKSINDRLGHIAGDKALQLTASILKKCVDKGDMISRYGGDEFCIVLGTSDKRQLDLTVEKINRAFDAFNRQSNLPYTLGISMGYAIYRYGMDLDEFQNVIDKLMYSHKHCEVKDNLSCDTATLGMRDD